jgi:hypothetical protein
MTAPSRDPCRNRRRGNRLPDAGCRSAQSARTAPPGYQVAQPDPDNAGSPAVGAARGIRCIAKPTAASAGPMVIRPARVLLANSRLEPGWGCGPDLTVEIITLRIVIGIGDVFIDVVGEMAGFEAQVRHQHSNWRGDQKVVQFLVPKWMTVQEFMLKRGMQRNDGDQEKDTQMCPAVQPTQTPAKTTQHSRRLQAAGSATPRHSALWIHLLTVPVIARGQSPVPRVASRRTQAFYPKLKGLTRLLHGKT